ncbi:MAG: cryptochrome/photolyase family protein, partial [Verrucomicrobiota bacterium]|nr:cryptochrome/photolyase family protein [Verrucomicrobiota bacterium]
MKRPRHLILIFGDQLNRDASAFDGFDAANDAVWMAEVDDESKHVWSHKQRIAIFLSGMRHFRDALLREDIRVEYTQLG